MDNSSVGRGVEQRVQIPQAVKTVEETKQAPQKKESFLRTPAQIMSRIRQGQAHLAQYSSPKGVTPISSRPSGQVNTTPDLASLGVSRGSNERGETTTAIRLPDGSMGTGRIPSAAPAPSSPANKPPAASPSAPTSDPSASPSMNPLKKMRLQKAADEYRVRQGIQSPLPESAPEQVGPPKSAMNVETPPTPSTSPSPSTSAIPTHEELNRNFIASIGPGSQKSTPKDLLGRSSSKGGPSPSPSSGRGEKGKPSALMDMVGKMGSPDAHTIKGAEKIVPQEIMDLYPKGTKALTVLDDIRSFYRQQGANWNIDVEATNDYIDNTVHNPNAPTVIPRKGLDGPAPANIVGSILSGLGVEQAPRPFTSAGMNLGDKFKSAQRRNIARTAMLGARMTGRGDSMDEALKAQANEGELMDFLKSSAKMYSKR